MTDWQVGDLALCVDAGDKFGRHLQQPKQGQVYRVAGLTAPGLWSSGNFLFGLKLEEIRSDNPEGDYCPTRFRKIRPDAEPCEAEFKTLIKRCAPKRVRA
ncbi:hypothetical protein [Novosphingopyxis sp. YJ-S2-01]|uniref:hypothetical protein n=1 Tax=Novosphingopyxis sp. YJ-S2-01 TaxID=2794021 RepID=UPI0018DC5E1E|nr:hypothetical protein [Novosphingopyxis sp. YJ-S2-01]MBH9537493.1 hypothetical protein [Novosphingopyxis sp. YJ-S2-01]